MDYFIFLIGLCLVLTGAIFFGFPVGRIYQKRLSYYTEFERNNKDTEPFIIRDARRRMDSKVCQKCAEREANFWAEVIE